MPPKTARTSVKRAANGKAKVSPVTSSKTATKSTPEHPKAVYAFAESLLRKQKYLSTIKTVPSSRPGSDDEYDEEDDVQVGSELRETVEELRRRICEVYDAVDGDPSNGRWTLISRMLKPPSTKGKYALWTPGPRSDTEDDIQMSGEKGEKRKRVDVDKSEETVTVSRNASLTERRAAEKAKLKEKVENWQQKVVEEALPRTQLQVCEDARTVASQSAKGKKKMLKKTPSGTDPLDPTPLGFTAQKSSTRMKPKAKQSGSVRKPIASSSPDEDQSDPEHAPRRRKITEIPETTFLPPSFSSSQIEHSTPVVGLPAQRRQPSPIPHIEQEPNEPPVSSSPLSPSRMDTSPLVAAQTRAKKSPISSRSPFPAAGTKSSIAGLGLSSSLPAFGSPKTPTRAAVIAAQMAEAREAEEGGKSSHHKRARPTSPANSRPAKLLRLDQSARSKGSPTRMVAPSSSPLSPLPTTPKKNQKAIPTLTELLSAKKSTPKGKAKPRRSSGVSLEVRLGPTTSPKRGGEASESVEMDINSAASRNAKDTSAEASTKSVMLGASQSQTDNRGSKQETQRTIATTTSLPQRQPGWDELSIQPSEITNYANAIDFTTGNSYPPAKSLSSISADSDSGEDEHAPLANPDGQTGVTRMPDLTDRSQGRSQGSSKEPVIVPNSPLPDFTFDAEAFAPQLASTQQRVDGDISLDLESPKLKSSPLRGAAARHSSQSQPEPLSRSPSKTPSRRETQSQSQFQFGYSSQMDLDGGVDKVSRFLEKDISMDIDDEEADNDGMAFGERGWIY
ncbi:hypothetical protein VNI00_009771 [Paramarasmius palmivorus]|uniref:Uncharacterized protein n=1 Tax=Paramarasmius palmivorus TaxID=297713 RepID=A0AAW0CPV4_9AGAR